MFQKPLVFVDTERTSKRRAFEIARDYAATCKVPLRIVDVVDDSEWRLQSLGDRGREVLSLIAEKKRGELNALKTNAEAKSVTASVEVLRGHAFTEVIREVLRNGHDVVFKTLMGEDEALSTSFGNLGRRLLRKCPCPVFLVHQNLVDVKRVVAAIGSEQPDTGTVTQRVLSVAGDIAKHYGTTASALHAWQPYGESMLSGYMTPDEMHAYIESERAAAQKRILDIIQTCAANLTQSDVTLVEGPPQRVIPADVSDPAGDLLVIGTVARSGLKGLLIGNTAEQVLDKVQCSFIAVKPEGFQSPVSL